MTAESPGEADPARAQRRPRVPSRSRDRAGDRSRSRRLVRAAGQRALAGRDAGRVQRPFAITPKNLGRLAVSIKQPIFWLGRKAGYTYEVTRGQTREDLRPLPARGRRRREREAVPHRRDVPVPRRVRGAARSRRLRKAPSRRSSPTEASPSSTTAIPRASTSPTRTSPTRSRCTTRPRPGRCSSSRPGELATLGGLHSVRRHHGPERHGAGIAASVGDLKALAARLGHPIYWAGPRAGYTYELTQTPSGKVYIRYLPSGTKVGDPRPRFLTVATYPFPGAYAAVAKRRRAQPGSASRMEAWPPSTARTRRASTSPFRE